MRSDLREFLGLGVGKGGVHTGWWVLWIVGLGLVWSETGWSVGVERGVGCWVGGGWRG